ncbi:MAG: hypothetical protein NTW54_12470 [Bacteroidetes bacterium]|nr:hypothetical protein [Bacteroidota bacterium]
MSSHAHHESDSNHSEKFSPLSDNNSNLSLGKFLPLLFGLILIFSAVVCSVNSVGYVNNEEQADWKQEHHQSFRDSNENKYYKDAESTESKGQEKEVEKTAE